jgi:hypothetical protein
MVGVVQVGRVAAAADAAATATRELAALGTDGTVDGFVGAPSTAAMRPVSKAVVKELATALNDDGFQYAQRDEVPRIAREIDALVKSLGGPAGIVVGTAKQDVQPSHLDLDGGSVPAQVWSFVNPTTADAIVVVVVKGTL